jgi:hypothetical protein
MLIMPDPLANEEGRATISEVLRAAAPRPNPTDSSKVKILYAVRFADKMAETLARDLTPKMKGIRATTKREASSVGGRKQIDVNFSTPDLGLALGISLKSVHIREATGAKRYTHNMKRNEEELRIEASGYHRRQPYAVIIGVLFLPYDSCDDARREFSSSSFGSWVRKLRPYSGRSSPIDEADRFEKLFIGLYEPDGTDLRFFDVDTDPPKNTRPSIEGDLLKDKLPRRLLTYTEFLDAAYHQYLHRNHADFHWADGSEEPLDASEIEGGEPAEK